MDIFKAVFERKLEEEKKNLEKEEKEKEQKKDNKDNKDNKEKIDKKKPKKEYKIFYSPYGYIKVDKSELDKNEPVVKFIQYKPAPFKVESCIFGKISTLNYVKEINFSIKTFYNEKKIYILEKINIFSTLQLAIKKMFDQEKKEKEKNKEKDKDKDKDKDKEEKNEEKNEEKKTEIDYEEERITEQSQYRIFSCRKQIHELNPTRNLIENDIHDNELLLYLPIKKLSFSEYAKGRSIIVSQEGKIASKVNTDEPQYVLGNIGYSFGKHYFEVNLLTEPIARSVIIGLATKKNPADMFINDVHNFYGYILSDMQKISLVNGKQEKKDYIKEPVAINDIIGVMFEFKKEGLEISFYKNKICLGIAYNKIYNDKIFFPAISLGIAGSKIQISNQIDFP
jgi:hypothetical protein